MPTETTETNGTNYLTELKREFPFMSDDDINRVIARAKFYYYSIKYPCNSSASETTAPIVNFKDQMWILEACEDLIQRLGIDNAVSYKENGVSINYDNAKISLTTMKALVPTVGVIQ